MDDYLIDRETLGKFVDGLIKKKALAVNNPEELNKLREDAIKSLDDRITNEVLGQLDDEQLSKINQMFDDNSKTENDFRQFFENAGINIENVMFDVLTEFGNEFLGGEDA